MKKVLIFGLIAGLAMSIVGMLYNALSGVAFPGLMVEYQTSGLFRPWEDPLMTAFFAYPFILGIALAWVWDKVKGLISGGLWTRALNFGLAYFIVATIPGMFISYTSFPVSLLMILSWSLSGLLNGIIAGAVLAKLNA